jgi:hypothetical protein
LDVTPQRIDFLGARTTVTARGACATDCADTQVASPTGTHDAIGSPATAVNVGEARDPHRDHP